MKLRRFQRLYVALWLGIVALAANGVEQHRFALTTLSAAGVSTPSAFTVPAGYHVMPDGHLMAGAMHGAAKGDGDHNVPTDCDACIAIAALGAFTLPTVAVLSLPPVAQETRTPQTLAAALFARAPPAYSSRAPPVALS